VGSPEGAVGDDYSCNQIRARGVGQGIRATARQLTPEEIQGSQSIAGMTRRDTQ